MARTTPKKAASKKSAKKSVPKIVRASPAKSRSLIEGLEKLEAANSQLKKDLIQTLNGLHASRESLFFPTPPTGPEYTHPGQFSDDRGTILRLTDKSVGSVQVIGSKKGSRRANHWHREDGHLCHVVVGKIAYRERPVGSDQSPMLTVFSEGQSFFTGPNLEHEMLFLEDTVFVCLANRHRTPEQYEKDLVRLAQPLSVDERIELPSTVPISALINGAIPAAAFTSNDTPTNPGGDPGAQP